ncbi:MAG: protein kinase [Proteobacteria bacterium]|nr:protein kinase [Pseudomonadota bacterium]
MAHEYYLDTVVSSDDSETGEAPAADKSTSPASGDAGDATADARDAAGAAAAEQEPARVPLSEANGNARTSQSRSSRSRASARPNSAATARRRGRNRLRSEPGINSGLPQVGDSIHHYEIIRELGRGGMGVVFLARDLRLGRRVAIKCVLSERAVSTERFLLEAQTTARCHHENIVVIHDIGEYAGNPFMVLEYLQGRPLRELVAGQAMAPARAVELMTPVARALQRAHEFAIVHRDLKPANIFVTDAGTVKVLDFGIAKHRDQRANSGPTIRLPASSGQSLTRAGTLVGTVPYMSPEQIAGNDIDHQTDLWAAGIILYELVVGRHPLAPLSPDKLESIAELDTPLLDAHEPIPGAGASGLAALIERCLCKRKENRIASAAELVAELERLAPGREALVLGRDESPFTGLAAFQETESNRFFGRNREIASVVAQLHNQPLVTLVGPSGSGKSSLIRAGVIPGLKNSGEAWRSLVIRPGRHPLGALATMLSELYYETSSPVDSPDGVSDVPSAERLGQQPGLVGQILRARARRKRCKIILLVDQFEELYTLGASAGERTAFVTCLESAGDDASSPLRVILSIRSDFLDRVVEDNTFSTEVARGLVLLPPMGRNGLRQALTEPVHAAGYHFDSDALVDTMLDALEATSGALPLLQFTATKLWETRDRIRRLLTRDSYDDMGGVAGTLASHADAVLTGMSSARRNLARAVLQRLVTPERTRAIATLDELRELPGDGDEIEHTIHHLADARLVAIESGRERDTSVELIHESLITRWPSLRRWLDEDQDQAEFLSRVRQAATQWQDSGRPGGMLWRGEPARQARRWHERYSGHLSAREQDYLDAVFAQLGRAARIKRVAIAGSMTLLASLLVAATMALVVIQDAERQATNQAVQLEQNSYELRRLLAREQNQTAAAEQARQEAEQARSEADRARAGALAEAERVRRAQLRAEQALRRARASEAALRQAVAQARTAETRAEAQRKTAERERARAEKEARKKQELIDRAVGLVKHSLTR